MYWRQISFCNPNSPIIIELILFNDIVIIFLVGIIIFVLIFMIIANSSSISSTHSPIRQSIEFLWILYPGIILIIIGVPSLFILYFVDEPVIKRNFSAKIIAHQWYWEFELPIMRDELSVYLDNNHILSNIYTPIFFLPYGIDHSLILTSDDTLHSIRLPSQGIKCDCIPGRLREVKIKAVGPSVNYGQCTEICGAFHSFIPFTLRFIRLNKFIETYYY